MGLYVCVAAVVSDQGQCMAVCYSFLWLDLHDSPNTPVVVVWSLSTRVAATIPRPPTRRLRVAAGGKRGVRPSNLAKSHPPSAVPITFFVRRHTYNDSISNVGIMCEVFHSTDVQELA